VNYLAMIIVIPLFLGIPGTTTSDAATLLTFGNPT
jgi:hypothetical protein